MWAIKHIHNNNLDGYREWFEGAASVDKPTELAGYDTKVFATRQQARQYIEEHYAYYRKRPDLRAEPHGWQMPRAVKVQVTVQEVQSVRNVS
jgi:hypothetical protein